MTITATHSAPVGGPGHLTIVASHHAADGNTSVAFAYADAFVAGAPGALDATFGTSGSVQRHVTSTEEDIGGIAIDPKGRIVVVGEGVSRDGTRAGTTYIGWAVRLTEAGDLDESFGTKGLMTNFGTPSSAVSALALVGDSPVMGVNLPTTSSVSSYVRKLLEFGSNDPSFGTRGDVSLGSIGIGALLRRSTGFLLVYPDFAIAAIDDHGVPLPFHAPHVAASPASSPVDSRDRLVYGTTDNAGTASQIGRLTVDGSPDPTFGTAGLVSLAFPGKYSLVRATSITVDAVDGPIALVESQFGKYYENQLDVVRVTNTGQVDKQFGTNGIGNVAPVGLGRQILFTDDGRILALYGVVQQNETTVDCRVARFESNGRRDATWGSGGDLALPDCPSQIAYDRMAQRLLIVTGGFGGMKVTRLWL